jgi:hypothetical protein
MKLMSLENILFIDIETASCFPSFNQMPEPWQHLWNEKIEKVRPENVSCADLYKLRAGVMAEFSKVVCISIGFFSHQDPLMFQVRSFFDEDEKKVLREVLDFLKSNCSSTNKLRLAGHNIKEFDIPFLCRRLLINGLEIPGILDFQNMKPWETNVVDTFHYWRFGDYKNYTSLKLLAAALDVPSSKTDIDGSMVGELFWKGDQETRRINLKRISCYCEKDVVATANILLRFQQLPILNEANLIFL